MKIRVRPHWVRGRTVMATVALAIGLAGAAASFVDTDEIRPYAHERTEMRLRACTIADGEEALQRCFPESEAVARYAPEVTDFEALVQAWETGGPQASAAAGRELAEIGRKVARSALSQHTRRPPPPLWLYPLWWLATLSAPIFLLYGLLSLYWSTRRFHVDLDDESLGIGPPTGVTAHPLGGLKSATIDKDRVVLVGRSRSLYTSPKLRITTELQALLDTANARIAERPQAFGSHLVSTQSPDAVRVVQLAPTWAVGLTTLSLVVGVLGLLATGGAGTMVTYDSYLRASWNKAGPGASVVAVCGRGAGDAPCTEITPPELNGVTPPHVVERWHIGDLTRAWHARGGSLPPKEQLAGGLDTPDAMRLLQSLREDPRSHHRYIWTRMVAVPEPARAEIEARAAARAAYLQTLFDEAWARPSAQADFEYAVRRDAELRSGFSPLWLAEVGPGFGLLLLVFSLLIILPPLLLRRSRFELAATATGLDIRSTHLPYAVVQRIELDRRRVVVTTRDGRTLRSGRLRVDHAAEPLIDAVRARMLDAATAHREEEARQAAQTVLQATRGRRTLKDGV